MSIMPRDRVDSTRDAIDLYSDMCVAPKCQAKAHPDMTSVPLCRTCAIRAAVAYHAFIENRQPDQTSEEAARAAAGRLGEIGFVYFIRFSDRIKIGFTTCLEGRLQNLPHDEVLATFPGTMTDEKRCHKMFAKHRVVGEWFTDNPDIRGFIAACSAAHA